MLFLYIKNASQFLISDLNENQLYLRKIALEALEKSIEAVRPKNLIEKSIRIQSNKLLIHNDEYNLEKYKKVYIIGGGKAAAEMAFSLEKILHTIQVIIYEGIINIPKGTATLEQINTSRVSINYASHPIPDENGLKGVKFMMEIVEKSDQNDLIICLISGGGSALLPFPKKGISLRDLQNLNSLLLASGTSIHEINTIRKHISEFKGGNLARKIYSIGNTTLISLVISDVVGDNLDSIASGPTVADTTTFKDALRILKNYGILGDIPFSIRKVLENGAKNIELENPKPNDICFKSVHNYLIGSVKSAVIEITSFLKKHGFEITYFSDEITGEAQTFGKSLYNVISQKIESITLSEGNDKQALIGTGELTVTLKGKGKGGRNQEMLLSFLNYVKDKEINYDFLIIGCNLDGIEGNSEAMGALIDNYLLNQLNEKNINLKKFLDDNDSYSFFKTQKSELITGLTGCNVNDLILILTSR
ncbi:hypothetical protein LCGC14_1002670 [marine sediment metagenome]|uniref:MOFRL-associated domain-containing protein n=1 Tax=marine sediment metagenome TaxID=412755 RepID=A0A0F9R8R5_9ZZZZ